MKRAAACLAPLALAASIGAFLGCREGDPPPGPAVPASTPGVATGTSGAEPAMSKEERLKLWDETARGLIGSFQARAYDPRRDARLEHAEGTLVLRDGDIEAMYEFTFDARNPEADPVNWTVVSEPPGLAAGTSKKAKLWAIQSCVGAWPLVVYHRPPVRLKVLPASDKSSKNLIVVAPEHRGPLNVSYSFDERQVVVGRGEWTDKSHKVVTDYEWESFRGRYLLSGERIYEGAKIAYDYDDLQGALLLSEVHFRDGVRAIEAKLTYSSVRFAAE
jgi:hypothetical protein